MKSKPTSVRKSSSGATPWVVRCGSFERGSFEQGHYGLIQFCKSWHEAMEVANAEAEMQQQIDWMYGVK